MWAPLPTWDHAAWISYFRDDLKKSVSTDIRPLLPERGSFGVPRQVFPMIEYLSGLVFGPIGGKHNKHGNTNSALDFLRQYMKPIDLLYHQHAEIFLAMWRHGPIHTYQPKVVQDGHGKLIGWLSYFVNQKKNVSVEHPKGNPLTVSYLTPVKCPAAGIELLPVSLPCLVDDLEDVLERIAKELRAEQVAAGTNLLDRMRAAAQQMQFPVSGHSAPFAW